MSSHDEGIQSKGIEGDGDVPTRIYTIADGRTVIEQSGDAVTLTADQILAVIAELHACYDYCAAWKQSPPAAESTDPGARS